MTYTTPYADLKMKMHRVYYSDTEYIKFRGSLYHKKYNYHYETKNYKLTVNVMKRWTLCE